MYQSIPGASVIKDPDQKAVRRGAFRSVRELQSRTTEFLAAWNVTPFVWTACVDRILEKVARARQRLEQIKPGSTLPKQRRIKLALMPSLLRDTTR